MRPVISIIIVNYNAGGHLRRCVNAVLASRTTRNLSIVIVDNASTDGSLDAGLELPGPRTDHRQISVIRNLANRGFAAACNQGIQQSRGSHFLFLNPDCIVEPDAIEEAYTNFFLLDRSALEGMLMIDRAQPIKSLLLQWGLPRESATFPAPDIEGWRPFFNGLEDPTFLQYLKWIESLCVFCSVPSGKFSVWNGIGLRR